MSMSMTERYWAARMTIVFITFIFSLLGTIVLTWMVRRHRDSARWCFTLAKFIGVLFSVYCFIDLCIYILWFAFQRLLHTMDYGNEAVMMALFLGRVELSALARFCDHLLIIFIFVSLITLSNGIILSRTGSPSPKSKLIKRSADGLCVIIGALAMAQLGLRIRVYLEFYLEDNSVKHGDPLFMRLLNIARQLDFASLTLALLGSLFTMGRAISIYLPTRADKKIYWPSYCLLFCSSSWLLRTLYDTVYQARYLDLIDVNQSRDEEYYISVITVIFYILPVLTILYAILGLGMRQNGGLWSTQQPWMLYNSDDSLDIPLEPQASNPTSNSASNPVDDPAGNQVSDSTSSPAGSPAIGGDTGHEASNLPPAYSPPQSSAAPYINQQPTTGWAGSFPISMPPAAPPQTVSRRPLPPLSTISLTLPTQQAPNHPHAEAAASSASPGLSQQPFVVEDRGPAPMPHSTSPRNRGQSFGRPSPVEQVVAHATMRRPVPESSIAAARISPPVTSSTGKPPGQPAGQVTPPLNSDDNVLGRYQHATMDSAYNTGIVSPESPVDLGPTDGFYRPSSPTSPPPHDQTMGFNHQADGRAPTEALPYSEKN